MVEYGALSRERAQEIKARLCPLLLAQPGHRSSAVRAEESPGRIRHHTFLAIRDFVLALCRRQPVVLVFEDLHWADDLSLDLIALLTENLAQTPLYLL